MNQKSHILICTLCNFHIGFEINQVDQIVQKRQMEVHTKEGMVSFHGYTVPYFDLPGLFECNHEQSAFLLMLNCSAGRFCVPIGSIEAIVDVDGSAGIKIAESIKPFVVFDYSRRVILWKNLPVPVLETEKIIKKLLPEQLYEG